MKGKVYILEEMGDNLRYKIGFTKNSVESRVKPLRTGNSDDIMVIFEYETVNYKAVETMIHRLYFKQHHRLEWFTMTSEEIIQLKKDIKKADENIDFLKNNNHFYNI
jgi:hypothetical protein